MEKTMKTKAIEILIVAAVVAVIVGVAFCFAGCKDKAEAATKSRVAQKVDEDIRRASEPNEPILGLTKCFERLLGQVDSLIDIVGVCLERIEKLEEPNEPMKYSLPIPTWPEYIELEKDLVIDITGRDEEPGIKKWWFGKGTKIYFKD